MNIQNLGVLVLAAGKSTRIHPISKGRPKPLLPIQNKPILEYNLSWLARERIKSLWINLHYKPEEIPAAIGDGSQLGLEISYSREPKILGTAGGYKKLEPQWTETTLVVYGDSLVRFDLSKFLATHRNSKAMTTIALFDRNTHLHTAIAGGRVIIDEQSRITQFQETPEEETLSSSLVNAAVYLLEPPVLDLIPSQTFYDFARDLFPQMLASGYHLQGHLIDGYCLGLDTPESYAKAMNLIETGKVKLQ